MKFTKFPKIQRFDKMTLLITQKLHGTNASIWIVKVDPELECLAHTDELEFFTSDRQYIVKAGKRSSFITCEKDNFGFAKFVHANKDALAEALGEGVHFGEWVGPGINSGEGLEEKRLALFNVLGLEKRKEELEAECKWPDRVDLVPVLYFGNSNDIQTEVDKAMIELKNNGSKYCAGFMRPEGVVTSILGTNTKFKKVFDAEETQWTKAGDKPKVNREDLPDIDHLLQPIRLEKLISRDEELIRNLPKSLKNIVSEYVKDLEDEEQFKLDAEIKALQKKALGKQVFGFVKSELISKGLM